MNVSSVSYAFTPSPAVTRYGQNNEDNPTGTGAKTVRPETAGAKENPELSAEESQQLEKLKARDREVRAHELAHLAAAGSLATSGASFTYQRGPDGASYAIGGEVQIDTSSGSNPEETIRKAQIIRAAAQAPAEPSGQDRSVAAKASQMEAKARAELATADEEEGSEAAGGVTATVDIGQQKQQAAVQQYQTIAAGLGAGSQFSLQA